MGDMADLLMEQAFDEWCELGCPDFDADEKWTTLDGEVVYIKDMPTRHLCNVLNFVTRLRKQSAVGDERWANLKREARRRGIMRTSNHGWKQVAIDKRSVDERFAGFTKIL